MIFLFLLIRSLLLWDDIMMAMRTECLRASQKYIMYLTITFTGVPYQTTTFITITDGYKTSEKFTFSKEVKTQSKLKCSYDLRRCQVISKSAILKAFLNERVKNYHESGSRPLESVMYIASCLFVGGNKPFLKE